jgi:hypothetical protein
MPPEDRMSLSCFPCEETLIEMKPRAIAESMCSEVIIVIAAWQMQRLGHSISCVAPQWSPPSLPNSFVHNFNSLSS